MRFREIHFCNPASRAPLRLQRSARRRSLGRARRILAFALLGAVASVGSFSATSAFADGLNISVLSQNPPNVVSRAAGSIDYFIRTNNFDAGGDPTTIGVGIRLTVNGRGVNASSEEFTAGGCSIDPSFPTTWACNDLGEGSSQAITFTWNDPQPGTNTIVFDGFCQVIPVPATGFEPCTFADNQSTTTLVDNLPPDGTILTPAASTTTIDAGMQVNFTGSATDPENDTPSASCGTSMTGRPTALFKIPVSSPSIRPASTT